VTGWGTEPWGTGPWGTGGASDLFLVSAFPTSERTVVVELSKTPRQVSVIGDGDALNPASWTVTNQATDEDLVVLASKMFNSTFIFELYTLKKFGDHFATHRVQSLTLRDQNDILLIAPTFVDFLGCKRVQVAATDDSLVDLRSNTVEGDIAAATLVTTSGGDYDTHSGVDLLRKLVIRRITTDPGAFFHYDETYGLGIAVKEPLRITDLPTLKKAVERQVSNEPEFDRVKAQVGINSNGTISLVVRARLRASGKEVILPFRPQIRSVQF